MDLIKDLWRGDVPLVKTYWLFCVAVGVLFNVVFTYFEYEPAVFETTIGLLFVFGLLVFFILYSAFICVAIWRSANKYGGPTIYAALAKFAVFFGVVAILGTIGEVFSIVNSG